MNDISQANIVEILQIPVDMNTKWHDLFSKHKVVFVTGKGYIHGFIGYVISYPEQ